MPIRKWKACFKTQLLVILKSREFMIGLLIILLYACLSFILETLDYEQLNGNDLSNIHDANQHLCITGTASLYNILALIYPFLLVLPCATSFVDDYKNGSLTAVFIRDGRVNYYTSKLAAVFACTTLVFLVPLLLNFVACNVFFPHNHYMLTAGYQTLSFYELMLGSGFAFNAVSYGLPFTELYLWSQAAYGLFYVLVFSLLSGLMASFTCALSFCRIRNKIIWFAPVFLIFYVAKYLSNSFINIIPKLTFEQVNTGQRSMGVPFFDVDLMHYITPMVATAGQSALFILGFTVFIILIMVLMTRYAVNSELKDLQ